MSRHASGTEVAVLAWASVVQAELVRLSEKLARIPGVLGLKS